MWSEKPRLRRPLLSSDLKEVKNVPDCGPEREETPKAAMCLACLIKNKETTLQTSVTAAESERKNSRDEIEGWVQRFYIFL